MQITPSIANNTYLEPGYSVAHESYYWREEGNSASQQKTAHANDRDSAAANGKRLRHDLIINVAPGITRTDCDLRFVSSYCDLIEVREIDGNAVFNVGRACPWRVSSSKESDVDSLVGLA